MIEHKIEYRDFPFDDVVAKAAELIGEGHDVYHLRPLWRAADDRSAEYLPQERVLRQMRGGDQHLGARLQLYGGDDGAEAGIMTDPFTDAMNDLARKFTAQGRLIESGWIALRAVALPRDAPQAQLDEMRIAFFAGAQHLFGSLCNIVDPEADVTDADMARMESIDRELRKFIGEFSRKHGLKTNGA